MPPCADARSRANLELLRCEAFNPNGIRIALPRFEHGNSNPDSHICATKMPVKTIQVSENVLRANSEIAQHNRARLADAGIVSLNLMASPGAGKTSLIEQIIQGLRNRLARSV